MNNIQKIKLFLKKNAYASIAAELVFAIILTALPLGHSMAAGQLTTRYIQMEDSGPSGVIATGEGDGLAVDYKVGFTPSGTSSIAAIIIEFCSNSAIIGDSSCTAPTSFNTNFASLNVANQAAGCGSNAFAVSTSGTVTSTVSRVVLTRTAQATSGACTFELGSLGSNGFTNPSTTGSFYARITTYAALPGTYTVGAPGTYVDGGSVALSTATVITITARVQESLIFCISATAPTSNCGGTTAPALTLGHGATGKIIDSTAVDTAAVYSQLSTNAGAGAIVRIHSSTASGGLETSSGSIIPPSNAGSASTPTTAGQAMTAGTAAFGLNVGAGSPISGGSGTVTAGAPYSGSLASSYYGMDTTTSGANVTTTFGGVAEQSTAPTNNVNSLWTFAATAANVTPAGVYSANISAIATGTF